MKLMNKLIKIFFKDDVLYINGSDILLPPLEKDVEFELLEKVKLGDMKARNILIEHNLRLVVYVAKRFETNSFNLEDLISIGTMGLIKAISTFKFDKNIKLATYVSRCISNEILMFLRKNKKKRMEISLEETLNYDAEGNTLSLEDVLGTDEDLVASDYEKKIDMMFLQQELNNLTEREKLIMTLRYGLNNTEEYTQKEVASMLGISQSYISRIEKKVIGKIKTLVRD